MRYKIRGSILVVSLMILGMMLVTALSIAFVSLQERKNSISSTKSTEAYQIAESGIEKVMQLIKDNSYATVADIDTDGSCDGVYHGSNYSVQLKDINDAVITDCTKSVAQIDSIKSIGTANGQSQRAIEAAVAAATNPTMGCAALEISSEQPSQLFSYAVAACRSLGSGWYLPSEEELLCFAGGATDVNGNIIASNSNLMVRTMNGTSQAEVFRLNSVSGKYLIDNITYSRIDSVDAASWATKFRCVRQKL